MKLNRHIKILKTKLSKNAFTKNIVMIASGAAFSQVINAGFSPIITRLYTPEQYGVLSIYLAVLTSLSFIGTLNYDMGIPIAENDEKAITTLMVSLTALTASVILLSMVVFLGRSRFLDFFNANELENYVFFILIGLFFKGIYDAFMHWSYREKNYKAITLTKYSQSISKNLLKVLFGLILNNPIGLIIGQIFGDFSGIIALSYKEKIKKRPLISKVTKDKMISVAKHYKDFPLYTTPRKYLGDITISIPVIFLTAQYGSQVAGFYGLADSIIQLPMNLIGTAISNVYYAEIAAMKNRNPRGVQRLSNKLLVVLILLGIFPLIVLLLWGPILFELVFGNNWTEAGNYARLLSVSIFARLIFKPISNIFDVFEKQRFGFILNVLRTVLVFLVFGCSMLFNLNRYWTIGLYSMTMTFTYFTQYLGAQKILRDAVKEV